jgi:two-component system, cell cycle sensor histidine kinase and response regulator CckA
MKYEVELFFSSPTALEYFKKDNHQHIDVVITDQTVPGMMGLGLDQKMMRIENDILIILCSVYGGAIRKSKLDEVGVKV